MAAVILSDVLGQLSASAQRQRHEGLANLKHLFDFNRGASQLQAIKGSELHAIYEGLFRLVALEKSQFAKGAKSKNSQVKYESTLEAAARALRMAVEYGVKRIRGKALRALLDHLTQSVSLDKDGYQQPLAGDYLRCLQILLEHQPHVEHLSRERWLMITDYCVDGITALMVDPEASASVQSTGRSSGRTHDGSDFRYLSGMTEQSHRERRDLRWVMTMASLVSCIRQLTKAPNAPILEMPQKILQSLTAFLRSTKAVGSAQHDALAAINSVMAKLTIDSIDLTQELIKDILPLMRDIWPRANKLPGVRDEILVTLIHSRLHIYTMLTSDDEELRSRIEGLIETLCGDYSKRQERELLQLDEISFSMRAGQSPLSNPLCSIRPGHARSEARWTLVAVIGYFSAILDWTISHGTLRDEEGLPLKSKRVRVSRRMQDYLRSLKDPYSAARIAALQITCFMMLEIPMDEDSIENVVHDLTACVSDDSNGTVVAWALLALLACARQKASSTPNLTSAWVTVWLLASRNISFPAICRPACYIMDMLLHLNLVSYSAVAESAASIISSVELNGPSVLADSSTSLLITLLRNGVAENPSAHNHLSERILQWLLSKWTPSRFAEHSYYLQNSEYGLVRDFLAIVRACLDLPMLSTPLASFSVLGRIGQAWLQTTKHQGLTAFLLLAPQIPPFTVAVEESKEPSSSHARSSGRQREAAESRLLQVFQVEVDKVLEGFSELTSGNSQNVNPEMLRILANVCILCTAVPSVCRASSPRKLEKLQKVNSDLARDLAAFISRPDCSQDKVDAVLFTLGENAPDIGKLQTLGQDSLLSTGISVLALHLSRGLDARAGNAEALATQGEDLMDIDEDLATSQASAAYRHQGDDAPRNKAEASFSPQSLRSTVAAFVHLFLWLFERLEIDKDNAAVPDQFVAHLVSMDPPDFLLCGRLLCSLFSSPLRFSGEGIEDLMGYIGSLMESYDYERCEVTHSVCLEVMAASSSLWTDPEAIELYGIGTNLYDWFTGKALESGIFSSEVQMEIGRMLQSLLQSRPNYAEILPEPLPSVRTSLLTVLQQGDIAVKYQVADRLPEMFGLYVLKEHDAIFDDVYQSLPMTIEWMEGTAIRLFVLSRLASTWHTLLRRCVYHIFEAAGVIPDSVGHATLALLQISEALTLGTPKELFRIFASQLLFTWLESQSLSKIPFSVFGYGSLRALLEDIEDEAVAQLVMRGDLDGLKFLTDSLETTPKSVVSRNFSKTVAYCISWDTCSGARSQDTGAPGSESYLKQLLVHYRELIHSNFTSVIGHLFLTMEKESSIEKAFAKKPAFTSPAEILKRIKQTNSSETQLPALLQPSFSAKFFLEQIQRLCRRVAFDSTQFWTPYIFVNVVRMLLDNIHPALGSLHACSIIRRIRVVISLAETVALQGYPLQMLLHSLRPFLTEKLCAEDALGIVQYLYQNGRPSLLPQMSFVAGLGVCTLISLRGFLGSTQDSTTQESQFRRTIDKAGAFHSWLTKYLEQFVREQPQSGAERQYSRGHVKSFHDMVSAAAEVRSDGNSLSGTPESRLLRELLDDTRSGRELLETRSRNLAIKLLCRSFQGAPSFREDILGSDKHALAFAHDVWLSCRHRDLSMQYQVWAAKVLGRAFSTDDQSASRATYELETADVLTNSSREKGPAVFITGKLYDLLSSDDRREAGLAEATLSSILRRIGDRDMIPVSGIEEILPEAVFVALSSNETDQIRYKRPPSLSSLSAFPGPQDTARRATWIRDLSVHLASKATRHPVVGALPTILYNIEGLAEELFPYILPVALSGIASGLAPAEVEKLRGQMSECFRYWFSHHDAQTLPFVERLLLALLYLRTQPIDREVTRVDRDRWLDLDYLEASQAAVDCGMYRAALLLVETHASPPVGAGSRKSSISPEPEIPVELQYQIYKHLDEPDSFYGVEQKPGLSAVLDRLDFEKDGVKSILFRSAMMDSAMRRTKFLPTTDVQGIVTSLSALNLNTVTSSLFSNSPMRENSTEMVDSMLQTARKLGQWEIKAPEASRTEAATLFRAFQDLNHSFDIQAARRHLDQCLLDSMQNMAHANGKSPVTKSMLRTLAILTETDEVLSSSDPGQLQEVREVHAKRHRWMDDGEFDNVGPILSCRETLFGILGANTAVCAQMHASLRDVREMEVDALRTSSTISRKHGALQDSLASAAYLSDIVEPCREAGLRIEEVAKQEVSNILWDQSEMTTSIRMRKELLSRISPNDRPEGVDVPWLLATLGNHIAQARLERPEDITKNYLLPAIKELKGQKTGRVAGHVHRQFALFCDSQLQAPGIIEDMARLQKQMERKDAEAREYERLAKLNKTKARAYLSLSERSRRWYNIDAEEYGRLRKSRESFLEQAMENYLISLSACEEYNSDVLRVFALWLEYSDSSLANNPVSRQMPVVPSRKFAVLMNQLSSRLQAEKSVFQQLLSDLVFVICMEHPYHGMHQIYAGAMPPTTKDEATKSRNAAAKEISRRLKADSRCRHVWHAIHESNNIYHEWAMYKDEETSKYNKTFILEKHPVARKLADKIPKLKVPPATLNLELRADKDYSKVPIITGFLSKITIEHGVSAPKVVTAIGSDGKHYKQLFKSGNDDMRQDAIMEQVFEQASHLLRKHPATRLRNLNIRTYKVLPLSGRSGLIEFVQNTIPLHNYIMPAHIKYYPKDWKADYCRKVIHEAQARSATTRVAEFRKVLENFHPVMRFFFLERFEDPDAWFARRLAYTRSTAAISILGHVLGLGDRHCHNILLDEKTGEVVHIDLGVAFEAGRVLPVPEVVPFRLTRDLVDGMGHTRTEGVFRRCCEFTMDTLRDERESIMTILNVLRYDPLVSWGLSPLKARRMQEEDKEKAREPGLEVVPDGSAKRKEDDAGEAARALSVVEKKLDKSMSVAAVVSELIQEATDERNLAVLYSGWAAFA